MTADSAPNTLRTDVRTVPYGFAVLCAVPHVYIGAGVPVAVILHAPTERFVGMRALLDPAALGARVADVDVDLLARYLATCTAVSAGDAAAGAIALGAPSERFHWLTAPRSDVLQCGPVHEGLCQDPAAELDALFALYVR